MKTRILLSVVLVMMLSLSTVLSVSADENEPQTAVTLENQKELSGSLTGNHAGAFWYATFDYPGDESVITVDVNIVPADPVTLMGVGFNLYGADGSLVGKGTLVSAGLLELQYSSATAGQLLLQVYNYVDGAEVYFNTTADGVPEVVMAEEEAVTTGEPTEVTLIPQSVEAAGGELQPLSGVLTGSNAGSFDHFTVFYDKDTAVTLDMSYFPADNIIADGVDLSVFNPNGEVVYTTETVNSNGLLTVSFNALAGMRYEIVVGNWVPNLDISYNINSSVIPSAASLSN